MKRILIETVDTPLTRVRIYKEPNGYVAEINKSVVLGHPCFDLQSCKDMIDTWVNKPIMLRGMIVDINTPGWGR